MAKAEEESSFPAGKVGTVGKNFTVNIPKGFLRATGWAWESGPGLIAHLLVDGRIRLRLASEVRPQIAGLLAEIQQVSGSERDEKMAVLADKYRDVKLYTSNNHRVQLDGTIAAYLGIVGKGERSVFIEPKKAAIDIMSLPYWKQRLADFSEEMDLGES